jgi:aspartyl-tRNA(Asn)/glutamyl-tRNA(Gln) amidotransferase subunit A
MTGLPAYMSLTDILAGYRSGQLSPVEVVQASLDRIEEVNPLINAIYHLEQDAAVEAATRSERRWRIGQPVGPLDGVPTTVKDLLPVKGMPGQYLGAAGQAGIVADDDHPAVARMREAGAVILGKNTMCDYGIIAGGVSSRHGPTRNPWNLQATSGASSSGAAASVSAGVEPVSIGTDIVGSIRLPASYCGLAGLKPSRGRVPYYFPNSPAVVAGPLARNMTDLALHMNVLARPDGRDFTALPYDGCDYTVGLDTFDPRGMRVLLVPDLGMGETPASDTVAAVKAAAVGLERYGAIVEIREKPVFEHRQYRTAEMFYKVRYLEIMRSLPDEQASRSRDVWRWTREALQLSAADYYRLSNQLDLLREAAVTFTSGHDFVLLPTTPRPAFGAEVASPNPDEMFEPWANTFLFNLSEQPAASIPVGLSADGLPIGLQIVGRRFDDLGVVRVAAFVERITPEIGFPQLRLSEKLT